MFSKRNKGFTLIELLVVIAIIGILASVVLASLNSARQKSRDARRIADLKQIQLALELCYDAACATETGYPDALSTLAPTYIAVVPTDPSSLAGYAYDNLDSSAGGACAVADAGNCLYYHLGAVLEDTSNAALDNDADKSPSADFGFDGNDADCDATDGAGTDACYDVTP
ncbi:MAG: type II secretion system protein [Candidatus Pacebacteria bacterium]|nr:type II secretion system protein [Candidatus Paceibacterota bacterium]